MEHSFDVTDAKKYGVECAIIIKNFRFWIDKNKANNKHFYEGKYWTYNSINAFSILFPYWTKDQIRRYLERLENMNVIVSGNFNKAGYDKTKWYSLNCQIDVAKLPNGDGEIAKPIPNDKTDSKPYDISGLEKPQSDYLIYKNDKEIDFNGFLLLFNTATGKNFRVINSKTRKQLEKALKEGYTKDDIRRAISNCAKDPFHIDNPKYLTPEFISRIDKIEKYANATTRQIKLPDDWYSRELTTEQQALLTPEKLQKWKDNKVRIGVEGGYLKPIER
jgi:uncharacterized phage protein (TIGR02220 family)